MDTLQAATAEFSRILDVASAELEAQTSPQTGIKQLVCTCIGIVPRIAVDLDTDGIVLRARKDSTTETGDA